MLLPISNDSNRPAVSPASDIQLPFHDVIITVAVLETNQHAVSASLCFQLQRRCGEAPVGFWGVTVANRVPLFLVSPEWTDYLILIGGGKLR